MTCHRCTRYETPEEQHMLKDGVVEHRREMLTYAPSVSYVHQYAGRLVFNLISTTMEAPCVTVAVQKAALIASIEGMSNEEFWDAFEWNFTHDIPSDEIIHRCADTPNFDATPEQVAAAIDPDSKDNWLLVKPRVKS